MNDDELYDVAEEEEIEIVKPKIPKPKKQADIVITGIQIPFFSLVWFMTTVAIAMLPVFILVSIIYTVGITGILAVLSGI